MAANVSTASVGAVAADVAADYITGASTEVVDVAALAIVVIPVAIALVYSCVCRHFLGCY